MFKIFLAILIVASGKVEIYTSGETYPTKETCEVQLVQRVESIRKFLEEKQIEVQLRSKCDVYGQPS